jgi:orotidine-5'-phosphate decarboxylase
LNRIPFGDFLARRVRETQSAVCVGLDPRLSQLPDGIRPAINASPEQQALAIEQFCFEIIEVVAPLVPVVKPQAAFFEQLGPWGMVALGRVIRRASDRGLIVILDGKRNDIGSTAEAYAEAYLGRNERSAWGSDALTVSPYLGEDSLQPFIHQCESQDAGIFVLVKTSNPGGGWLQDRKTDKTSIYQHVAELVQQENSARLGESGFGPIGAVVGATYPEQLADLRNRMSAAWILIPGFGAQGGAAEDVRPGFDQHGMGAIVNSSRHIIFAHTRKDLAGKLSSGTAGWLGAVEAATLEMNQQLNGVRPG